MSGKWSKNHYGNPLIFNSQPNDQWRKKRKKEIPAWYGVSVKMKILQNGHSSLLENSSLILPVITLYTNDSFSVSTKKITIKAKLLTP